VGKRRDPSRAKLLNADRDRRTGAEVTLPYNWNPRDDQLPLWVYLQDGGNRAVEVAHRKWGKDTVALRWASFATQKRIGSYWHMLPKYSEARKAIWEPIDPATGHTRIEDTFPKEICANIRDTDMFVKLQNGSTWQMVGSDNYNSLVGAPPVGIVFSEWSLCDPKAWAYMQPILEQNGGWALFIYTSRGPNHGMDLLNFAKKEHGWFWEVNKASQTNVLSKEQLGNILRQFKALWGEYEGQALYDQEYECSFTSFQFGAYYAQEMKQLHETKHICEVPWEQGLPVYTAWDLGVDDSMSIWCFQVSGSQFRFIDYIENVNQNFAFYREELLENRPYIYTEHFLPHDVRVREMGSGASGDGAKSRKQVLEGMGIKPITVVERPRDIQAVLSGIFSAREILPFCYFDEKKCARGLSALEGYSAKYDEDRKTLLKSPDHNWTSHGADAFRTFAVGWRASSLTPGRNPMEMMEKYYGQVNF